MTTIDLQDISLEIPRRWRAIEWLEKKYGPMNEGHWKIHNLRYLTFKNERDATLFILKWSS